MDDSGEAENSTYESDLCRVQEGHQGRASVCLETESDRTSSQGRSYPSGESTSRLPLKDNGCKLYPDCLTCPLPNCIYDTRRGKQVILNRIRNAEIVRQVKLGKSSEELAEQFGVGVRTIQRALGGQ